MTEPVVVLVLCLVAGLLFAALAVWLTTQRGNTIRDILESKNATAQELRVEVGNRLKVATNIPVVGLWIVAAAVATVLPAFWHYEARQQPYEAWRVSGKVADPQGGRVYATVHPPKLPLEPDGSFNDEIPVRLDQDGRPIFPSIVFRGNADATGHDAIVIHVMDPWQKYAWERTGDRAIRFKEPLNFDISLRGE